MVNVRFIHRDKHLANDFGKHDYGQQILMKRHAHTQDYKLLYLEQSMA